MNLLRNKMWAYPVAIALLLGFVGYQIFRFCQHFSWTLSAFTILDIIIVGLIALEYRAKLKED